MYMYKYKGFNFGFILLSMYQEIDIHPITRTTRADKIKVKNSKGGLKRK